MNQEIPITVIMSVYNGESSLRDAVESILNQSMPRFEFLIVNDASTDGTAQILRFYKENDKRIEILTNERNLGLTRSLNRALNAAKGRFVARQDADDISLPNRLERQYEFLMKHADVCMAAASFSIIDPEGKEIFPRHYDLDDQQIVNFMKRGNIVTHGSVMFRRKEILELGGYREYFQYAQDYDLWLRILDKYNIYIIPEYLYKIRLSVENLSMKRCFLQEQYARLARRFYHERKQREKDDYSQLPASLKEVDMPASGRRASAKYHYLKAMYLLGADKISSMRRELIYSWKNFPFNPNVYFFLVLSLFGLKTLYLLRRFRDWIYKF